MPEFVYMFVVIKYVKESKRHREVYTNKQSCGDDDKIKTIQTNYINYKAPTILTGDVIDSMIYL